MKSKYRYFIYIILVSFAIHGDIATVERVVAAVDGTPILLTELNEAVDLATAAGKKKNSQLYHDELYTLIDNLIVEKHCNKLGIEIKIEEVEQYLAYYKHRFSFKQMKTQLYKMRLMQAKIKNLVNEAEVEKELAAKSKGVPVDFELRLERVLFKPNQKNTAELFVKQVREKNDFLAASKKLKAHDKTVEFAEGVVGREALENDFVGPVFRTGVGEITDPILSKGGWHVFFVKERIIAQTPLEQAKKEQYEKEAERLYDRYMQERRKEFSPHTEIFWNEKLSR